MEAGPREMREGAGFVHIYRLLIELILCSRRCIIRCVLECTGRSQLMELTITMKHETG